MAGAGPDGRVVTAFEHPDHVAVVGDEPVEVGSPAAVSFAAEERGLLGLDHRARELVDELRRVPGKTSPAFVPTLLAEFHDLRQLFVFRLVDFDQHLRRPRQHGVSRGSVLCLFVSVRFCLVRFC